MRLDEAAPRNSTKLPETVEEQRRLLRERTLATKAEALKNQRREAAELRKVLSSVRPAESTVSGVRREQCGWEGKQEMTTPAGEILRWGSTQQPGGVHAAGFEMHV